VFQSVVPFLSITLKNHPKACTLTLCHDKPSLIHFLLGRYVSPLILFKQLRVEGFIVTRWLSEWPKAFREMATWIQEVHVAVSRKSYSSGRLASCVDSCTRIWAKQ
jgi:prostaglandin reductase 1